MNEIAEFRVATIPGDHEANTNVEIGVRATGEMKVVGEIIGEFGLHRGGDFEMRLTHLRTGATIYYHEDIEAVRKLAKKLMEKPSAWRHGTFGVRPVAKWRTHANALLRAALRELGLPYENVSALHYRERKPE